MAIQTDETKTWKDWEDQGDSQWEKAFAEDTFEQMQMRREEALGFYEKTYKALMAQSGKPLDLARLCRKRARCYRKLAQTKNKGRPELIEAESLLKTLPQDDPGVIIEKTKVELEHATLDLMSKELAQVRDRTEAIISTYMDTESPVYGNEESWRILGEAYNLLGIVLDQTEDLGGSHCSSAVECWEAAETNFSVAGDNNAAKRGKQDVSIQQAARLQRLGNYREALSKWESVRDDLTPERELVVENNIIEAYLQSSDPISAASEAKALLKRTRQTGDVEGQIVARELYLKALRDLMATSSTMGLEQHFANAKDVYYPGIEYLNELSYYDTSADRLELHRIMIEICLQAGDLQRAETVLNDARTEPGFPLLDDETITGEERADWEVTMGQLAFAQRDLDAALQYLDRAYDFFRSERHHRAIETGLLKLKVLSEQGDLEQAREILYQIEGIARGKKRTPDVQRIGKWEENIGNLFDYERGLRRLAQRLAEADPAVISDFDLYEARLSENLRKVRRYGDSENLRADRNEIVDRLNQLVREQLSTSFNDLCRSKDVLS
jgi:tetratricopeptide (TPR) repeat protein